MRIAQYRPDVSVSRMLIVGVTTEISGLRPRKSIVIMPCRVWFHEFIG